MIRLCVIVVDFIILNAILGSYIVCLPDMVPVYFHSGTRVTILVANVSLTIGEYFYSTVIYYRELKFSHVILRSFRLTFVTAAIMFIILRLISQSGQYFVFMCIFAATMFVALLLARRIEIGLVHTLRRRGYNTRSVIFVGNNDTMSDIYNYITQIPSAGIRVLGYYADLPLKHAPKEFKHLGSRKRFGQIIREKKEYVAFNGNKHEEGEQLDESIPRADMLFCSLPPTCEEEIRHIIDFCDNNIIRFFYLPQNFHDKKIKLYPDIIMGISVLTNHESPLFLRKNRAIKRGFDITVSGIVCLVMLPFIPIIGAIIKISSKGPIFFRQQRTGLDGNIFYCYKFRSMHMNKAADTLQATKDDPRKFAFGEFMRKTNIDEFPQFFNVLKGDMSIVGPRPHMLAHTKKYSELISNYMIRHFYKPGITGWAQVTGFRGETKQLSDMEERVKRDLWYMENWTLWLDIKIICMTLKTIFIPDKKAY